MVRNHSREQLLQHMLGSMAVHVVAVNRRGRVTYVSPSRPEFAAFRGVRLSDLRTGVDFLALLGRAAGQRDAYARAALEGFRSVLFRQSRSFSLEYPCDCPSQSRWYLMRVDPMPARHGGAIVSQLDITDRVLARQQLQESLERYELATLSGRIALWDWEVKTGVFRVDPALKRLLGFDVQQIEDRIESWCERVHADDRELYGAALEAHLRGETPSVEIEHRKIDASGNVRWFLSRGSLQRDAADIPVRMLGLDTDITDRKAAEQALIRETRRYHDIFAAAGVAIVEADYTPARQLMHRLLAEGVSDLQAHLNEHPELVRSTMAAIRSVDANPQAVRLVGARTRQALLNHGLAGALLESERHFVAQLLALADGCKEYTSEARMQTLQGEYRDIVLSVRFPTSAGLRQIALLCAHDVTELVSFQQRYAMATAAGTVSVFDCDLTTGLVQADPVLYVIAGVPVAAARTRAEWMEQVHPDDRTRMDAADCAVAAPDAPRDAAGNSPYPPVEFRLIRSDGTVRWLLKRGRLVRSIDGTPVRLIGTLTDITSLKRGETALRRMHRKIRELTAQLVATQEAERRRIARELHDDVNQRLAGAAISLSNLQVSLNGNGTRVAKGVARLQAQIRDLIIGIRRISHELHPGVLEHAGLEAALRSLCHDFGLMHGLTIRVDIYDLMEPLPPHLALCCYRVVQEALHNLTLQGESMGCTVRLYQDGESLVLSVRNPRGKSLLTRNAARAADSEMFSVKGRVRLLGGRLRVATRAGRSSELRAVIPIHTDAAT